MAYTINKTDGTIVAQVEDGVLNNDTSLQLIGRNYQSYGQAFNENLVKLLENSASTSAPTNPVRGELWYDVTGLKLKVYDGSNFVAIGATRNSATAPTDGVKTGDLWNHITNDQLYMYDGTNWDLIGPIYKTGDGKSGWLVDEENLSGGGTANVVSLYQDGTRVGILSATERTLASTPTGFDSATIQKGLTFYTDTDSTTFRLHGTAQNALELGGSPAADYINTTDNSTMSGTLSITNNQGLSFGANSEGQMFIDSNNVIIQNNNFDSIFFRVNQSSVLVNAVEVTNSADLRVYGNLQVDGNLVTTGSSSSFADSKLVVNDASPRASNQNAGLDIEGGSASADVTLLVTGSDGGYLESSSGLSVATGKVFSVNGTSVLNATTLGSGVTASSLTQVGDLSVGNIVNGFGPINNNGNPITTTGVTSNDDIIVEASSSDSTVKASITASSGNILSQGTVTGTAGVIAGNTTISGNTIVNSSGGIDFDNENLETTGTITGASITVTTTDTSILKSTDSTLITVQDGMSIEGDLVVETISSDDSTFITINNGIELGGPIRANDSGAVQIDEGLRVSGALTVADNFTVGGTTTVSQILDEDAFDSDSATALATQQSIKAYVATQIATISTDLFFSLNTTGLSNANIASLLDTLAPNAASGTKARIAGVSITASSSSSSNYVAAIGDSRNSVATTTTTTLNHTRNNDLIFTRGASNWAYTSG